MFVQIVERFALSTVIRVLEEIAEKDVLFQPVDKFCRLHESLQMPCAGFWRASGRQPDLEVAPRRADAPTFAKTSQCPIGLPISDESLTPGMGQKRLSSEFG